MITVTLPARIWQNVADIIGHELDSEHYEEFPQTLADLETAHEAIEAALQTSAK